MYTFRWLTLTFNFFPHTKKFRSASLTPLNGEFLAVSLRLSWAKWKISNFFVNFGIFWYLCDSHARIICTEEEETRHYFIDMFAHKTHLYELDRDSLKWWNVDLETFKMGHFKMALNVIGSAYMRYDITAFFCASAAYVRKLLQFYFKNRSPHL